MTTFVLSPSVETTTASASSIPASRRTSVSMPCPTRNRPGQFSPSRESASSFSSITVTSQPSFWSWSAMVEPTRPQPMINAFTKSDYSPASSFEHPLREGDDQHLGVRLAEHVVDRRREEPRLAAPARRRAEDDQVGLVLVRRLHDRLADRARADRPPEHLHAVLGAERMRLSDRGGRLLLEVVERRLDRLV